MEAGGKYDNINKLKMLVKVGNKQICSDIARMVLNFCHINDNYKELDNWLFFLFLFVCFCLFDWFVLVVGGGQGRRQYIQNGQYDWYLLSAVLLERQK